MIHHARQHHRFGLAASVALVALAPMARAQEGGGGEGPIIINQPRETQNKLHLDPAELTLRLEGVYQHSKISSGTANVTTDDLLFTQRLDLKTHGYIVDPNFIELNVAVGGGISEEFLTIDGQSTTSENPIYDWDLSATLLRNGEWPLTLYSTRQQSWLFREFGGAIDVHTTQTGARVAHVEKDLTTNLDASHLESTQTGTNAFDNLSYTQDRLSWFSSYHPSANQTLTWNYNYANTVETGATKSSYSTQDATLAHEARFGEDDRSSLQSSLNYSDYTGSANVQRFRWDEHLILQHTKDFRTRYDFSANQTDINGSRRNDYRGSVGFTHFLYKSLTTSGNVGAERSDDSQGGGGTQKFADLTWNYRKAIPYGELSADLGFSYAQASADAGGAVTTVGQPGFFFGAPPIVIIGANIDPNTIVLRDPSGLLFLPGVDYATRGFADHVEIQRIIGGRIGDGSSVLIDYTRAAQSANSSDTNGLFTGLRYDIQKGALSGLSLYGRYAQQNQSVSSDDPGTFVANSFTDTLYGTEYRLYDLTVGAEQQWHDSTVFPYDATRYFGRYVHQDGETTYSLNAAYTTIHYPNDNNINDLYTISARADHRFSTRLTGDATVMWRDERNQLFGDTTGFEEQLGLRWAYRQVTAYVQLRASQLRTNTDTRQFEFVRIGVERKF